MFKHYISVESNLQYRCWISERDWWPRRRANKVVWGILYERAIVRIFASEVCSNGRIANQSLPSWWSQCVVIIWSIWCYRRVVGLESIPRRGLFREGVEYVNRQGLWPSLRNFRVVARGIQHRRAHKEGSLAHVFGA